METPLKLKELKVPGESKRVGLVEEEEEVNESERLLRRVEERGLLVGGGRRERPIAKRVGDGLGGR